MVPSLQWLNDNWFQVVGPVLIVVIAGVGGVWLRRLAFDAISHSHWKTEWRPAGVLIGRFWHPVLEWAFILGLFLSINLSALPASAIIILNRVVGSFLLLSVARLVMAVSERLFLFYEIEFRKTLNDVKAPQPPRALIINIIRAVVALITVLLLLRVWQGPDVSGLLALMAFAVVGILALHDFVESSASRPLTAFASPLRNRQFQKTVLSVVAVALVIDIVRRLALAPSGEGAEQNAAILWVVLEVAALIWATSNLRRSLFVRTRPRFATVAISALALLFVPALLGVEPLSTYFDNVYAQAQTRFEQFRPQMESFEPTASESANLLDTVRPAVVRVLANQYQGTGMIVDTTGRVLTAYHVVEGCDEVRVVLVTDRYYDCAVAAHDAATDLAVLVPLHAVATPDYVTLGRLADVQIGDDLWVMGYPLDLAGDATVNKGIVSAVRHDSGVDYIQTDAPVNPGNSGGPLINQQGRVVAVASFKLAAVEIEGMQFGVAIDHAIPLLESATKTLGSASSASMDVRVMELVNAERSTRAAVALAWDEELATIARAHATEMADQGTMFHSSMYEPYAENCWEGTLGYFDADDIVDSWMGSERHRTWLLCPHLTRIGVGIANDGTDMYVAWTFWRREVADDDWWYVTGDLKPDWWY